MSTADADRLRAYLLRQIALCDTIAKVSRHPEPRSVARAERVELEARLAALDATTEVRA